MLKAALEEATLAVRRLPQGNSAVFLEDSPSIFLTYWIRGECIEQLKRIAKVTGCLALRKDLDRVCQLPRLSRADFPPGESDTW